MLPTLCRRELAVMGEQDSCLSIFLSIEHQQHLVAIRERSIVCVFRWGPAVFRCNASCVADCTEKKAGFKQNRCGYVYSVSQLLYCSHIYIYSVLDICVRELLICMQFSCDSRSRVDPFIPGVLSCSRTTDTSKCFILSLFCSAFFLFVLQAFFSILLSIWRWLHSL